MFFSSLLIQGDFTARLTAVWADDGTPCKRFVPRSGPRIPMEKPDPMVSAHPIWWLSSAPHFFGSTLASTCPATFVFAVDVSFFFHGSCPHTFSSYPPFQPWVDVLSFLLPFLVPFCIGIHERHPFLDWILIVLFLYLCHWNLVYALCLCLCFVLVVLPLPLSFLFLCVVVVLLLLSVIVWVLLSYYTKIATGNKSLGRPRQGKMTAKNPLQHRNFCHYG